MRPLSDWELLRVWEQGLAQPPVQRSLALLAAACPDEPFEALAQLSIGRRDARLLTLREWTFGPRMVSLVTCPACAGLLELSFDVAEIRVAGEDKPVEPLSVDVAGYTVSFRLPNSRDLAATADRREAELSCALLLARCLVAADQDGAETPVDRLPVEVCEAVVDRMAQADPQADVQLALTCPHCDHLWQATFDIASFFWAEIHAWAQRTLRQVHLLASAYGWSEADILAMSAWRRQCYLELVSR